MSPFRAKPGYTYKIKIRLPDGRYGTFSTGTPDTVLANAVDSMVDTLHRKRKWDALEAVVMRRIKLPLMFDVYEREGMAGVDAMIAVLGETDLSPLVDTMLEDPKYKKQVRRLIPAGKPFRVSEFTRGRISDFLSTLTREDTVVERAASASTKNRYKAAISSFAQALVEAEIIDANPTREIVTKRQRTGSASREIVYLPPASVEALVRTLSGAYQALEALMAGTGMELGACLALRPEDVNFDNRIVLAKGTKNDYRNRYVEVTEDWAWDLFAAYARTVPATQPLFTMSESQALRQHANATAALGLPYTTLHHHRNSFTVMWIQRGVYGYREDRRDKQWLKNQLGHAPQSTLLDTRYGVYINAAKLTETQKARQRQANIIPISSKKRA